jgi:hypothetical protein
MTSTPQSTPFSTPPTQFVYVKDPGLTRLAEKRQSARVDFCSVLDMNQQQPTAIPSQESFESIESRDLSQGGLSFYCQTAPPDRWLIIRLADESGVDRFLTARIVRCEKDYDDEEKRFTIGCEFTGRLEPLA